MELVTIHSELKELRRLHSAAYNKRMELERSKNERENLLSNNLMLKQDDLEQSLRNISPSESRNISQLEMELETCKCEVMKNRRELDEIEVKMREHSQQVSIRDCSLMIIQ